MILLVKLIYDVYNCRSCFSNSSQNEVEDQFKFLQQEGTPEGASQSTTTQSSAISSADLTRQGSSTRPEPTPRQSLIGSMIHAFEQSNKHPYGVGAGGMGAPLPPGHLVKPPSTLPAAYKGVGGEGVGQTPFQSPPPNSTVLPPPAANNVQQIPLIPQGEKRAGRLSGLLYMNILTD